MVPVVSVHQILQDGATFPDLEFLATLVRVDDGRDAAVWIDVEVPLLFLLVFKEFDCAYLDTHRLRQDFQDLCLPLILGVGVMMHWGHTLYFKPNSSSAMEILSGLGVPSQ